MPHSTPHEPLDAGTLRQALERWWDRVSQQTGVSQADRLRAHLIGFAVRDHISEPCATQLSEAFAEFELHMSTAPRGRDGVEAARSTLLSTIYAALKQLRVSSAPGDRPTEE